MPREINQFGFSMLELILVIVLLGILASGAGLLITRPIETYNDQLRRQQLVDQAEMALRQIARDIRRALPNSIQVDATGIALEMINTIDGARYRDEVGGVSFVAANDWLDFSAADSDFNLLGQFSSVSTGVWPANQRLVIYNTAPTDIYQDINIGVGVNSGIVTAASTTVTVSNITADPSEYDEYHINLSPAFQFTQQSPGQRTFVIDGAISYICNTAAGTITRYDNYPYQSTQLTSDVLLSALSGVESGLVVSQLSSCNISYNAGTAQRGGIVTIEISLNDATGESISLLHQVHVVNVP